MHFELMTDPVAFRSRAQHLLADEARHNLMLGILTGMALDQTAYGDFKLMLVSDNQDPVTAALMTPPYRLAVADTATDVALRALIEGVLAEKLEVAGVIANRPTVGRFVEIWQEATDDVAELAMSQGVFSIDAVVEPRPTRGRPRNIRPDDADLVFDWVNAFVAEALPDEPRDDTRLRHHIEQRLNPQSEARIWLWDVDDVPVSMSWNSRLIGAGARVNAVYTPPPHRGNGYASSLVAAQADWLLNNGAKFCFLFTDLANPTSNKIYESIGYRQVAEAASYNFSRAT